MVKTRGGYKKSGESLQPGLQRIRQQNMEVFPREEQHQEDLEVRFARLEQNIVVLIEIMTHILKTMVVKKEEGSAAFEQEESILTRRTPKVRSWKPRLMGNLNILACVSLPNDTPSQSAPSIATTLAAG